jgi:hypothetical protein
LGSSLTKRFSKNYASGYEYDSFRMPSPIFLAADFKLSVERARRRCNDIAAQDTEPLPRLNQFSVGKRSNKFAVIVFVEFTEPDWAGHCDTHGWGFAAETGDKSNTRHRLLEFSMVKKKDANGKPERQHHYFRVVVTYNNGETSGNRAFKEREKAEEWAARQKKSPIVKKAVLEPFLRDAYAALGVHRGTKRR